MNPELPNEILFLIASHLNLEFQIANLIKAIYDQNNLTNFDFLLPIYLRSIIENYGTYKLRQIEEDKFELKFGFVLSFSRRINRDIYDLFWKLLLQKLDIVRLNNNLETAIKLVVNLYMSKELANDLNKEIKEAIIRINRSPNHYYLLEILEINNKIRNETWNCDK